MAALMIESSVVALGSGASRHRSSDLGAQVRAPWFGASERRRWSVPPPVAEPERSACDVGERRTALAYEPRRGVSPVLRIAVEFDERGRWAVVVDGVVLRYLPDAESAIDDARRLESTPRRAAYERDAAQAQALASTPRAMA